MSQSRKLVIVESPAKARTIAGYLGAGFDVEASIGHIRDLPQPSELPPDLKKGPFGRFAVDVDNGFEPYYVVDADKKKKVAELKRLLKDATELYLATDEDREGEAIAWHLLEVLKPKVPVKRMVFHEITRPAIEQALAQPRDVDTRLVDAQEARRIVDRLYGYELSPVLWRKVRNGLSAGRVQSVATRLVVERERERMAFVAAGYWDIAGLFGLPGPGARSESNPAADDAAAADDAGPSFAARLASLDGQRVATGRDFDDAGRLAGSGQSAGRVVQLDQAAARALADGLAGADFVVADVAAKPYTRRPAAPFTTSTLQQEASRKLRLGAQATMRLAQRLYESGYITYMRTDSTALAAQAIDAARRQAVELYGPSAIPERPRHYQATAKGAQEAHEAIRPAGDSFRTPVELAGALSADERRLYELIWKRTIASQMADARGQTVTVRLRATSAAGQEAEFAASGTVITQRGFLAAYEEGRDASRYAEDDGERRLPELAVGQAVSARELNPEGHETTPPPRYTEASLVAALEKRGIGRPSTYAATMAVIEDRGYVGRRAQALIPTWLAFAVTQLLEQHFADLVDYDFTAEMEAGLDQIASGEMERAGWLRDFYFGQASPGTAVADETGHGLPAVGLRGLVEDRGEIDARDVNTVDLGDGVELRVGRYGPYLEAPPVEAGGPVRRATVPEDLAPDELTAERITELFERQDSGDRELGVDPASGRVIVVRDGRYGPYVTEVLPDDDEAASASSAAGGSGSGSGGGAKKKASLKPRTASLFKTMSLETVTLDDALRLFTLPRLVGLDPASGEEITAQNGRYGPYLKKGADSRSLASEEQMFSVSLDEALALYAQPKYRTRAAAATAPLRELGADPASGKPVLVKEGRFGPYVTDGETNATLRKADDPASISLDRAAELLADKRARGPAPRRGAKKTAAKKTTAKKSAAKKTAAKKTAAKKAAPKKAA